MAGEQTIGGALESVAASAVAGAAVGAGIAVITPSGSTSIDEAVNGIAVYSETLGTVWEEAQAAEIEPLKINE